MLINNTIIAIYCIHEKNLKQYCKYKKVQNIKILCSLKITELINGPTIY